MKLPIDKSQAILLTLVVTYSIALAVLVIGRKSGESAPDAATPATILNGREAPGRPVGPGRPKSLGQQPGRGMRPQQRDPAQPDPG
jgi:hypothetical protein